MNFIEKIKASVEAHDVPFYYGSPEDINVVLDSAEFPCAICLLLQQGSVTDINGQYHERATFLVSFADLTQHDFNSLENEDIIDDCKKRAFEWLTGLRTNDNINLISVNNTTRDYLAYDAIITGFGVNVTIEETRGYGVCDFAQR